MIFLWKPSISRESCPASFRADSAGPPGTSPLWGSSAMPWCWTLGSTTRRGILGLGHPVTGKSHGKTWKNGVNLGQYPNIGWLWMAFFVEKKMHKMHRSKIPWMIPNSRKWGPLATANGSCILLCPVTWDPKSASACFQVQFCPDLLHIEVLTIWPCCWFVLHPKLAQPEPRWLCGRFRCHHERQRDHIRRGRIGEG